VKILLEQVNLHGIATNRVESRTVEAKDELARVSGLTLTKTSGQVNG